jgi:hypothetical protein
VQSLLTPVAGILVLAAYLGIRLLDLDRMVTIDETLWIGRSANFLNALVHADWDLTYQMAHPGVMTMWAGALGLAAVLPEFARLHPEQVSPSALVHGPLREVGADPLQILIALRIAKLIMQSIVFMIGVWFLRRLFDGRVAFFTGLMIALEPFLIGHDRLLHIDGLFAASAFTAVLAIALAARERSSLRLWIVAGLLSAITWLSRTPGLVLVPVAGCAIMAGAWIERDRSLRRLGSVATLRAMAVRFVVFSASLIICSVALWPALWAAPQETVTAIMTFSENAAVVGHETTQVFNGEVIVGDPGPWYYPVTLAWRLSPLTIAGVALFLALLLFARRTVVRDHEGFPLLIVGGFGLVYFLGMTLAAKKFDRYILPDYQVLVLLSVLGWMGVGALIWRHHTVLARVAVVLLIGVVLAAQGAIAVSTRPYGLDYFSPLLGGISAAEGNLLLGWGEGLDEAAAIILAQPDGEQAVVATSNNRTSLLYFLPATAEVLPARWKGTDATVLAWTRMDYFVAYTMQWQRNGSFEISYLKQFEPIGTVDVNGVEFARVYDVRDIPPPPDVLTSGCVWNFEDRVSLLTWESNRVTNPFNRKSRLQQITVYLASGELAAEGQQVGVTVTLLPDSIFKKPIEKYSVRRLPSNAGMIDEATATFALPRGDTLDDYEIMVEITDPAAGKPYHGKEYRSGDIEWAVELDRCER